MNRNFMILLFCLTADDFELNAIYIRAPIVRLPIHTKIHTTQSKE